jgi:hypothetical protein
MSLPDGIDAPSASDENKQTAIFVAALAVMLAICSVGGDNATKDAMRASIESADAWAFYQAKNLRQTNYALAADSIERDLANPALDEASKKLSQEKMAKYRATVERYETEPATGDGKKELVAKAKSLETVRDLALKRDPYFDYAQGMLQIAIVLASSSAALGTRSLLWIARGLGVLGTLFMFNAFFLLVNIPGMG